MCETDLRIDGGLGAFADGAFTRRRLDSKLNTIIEFDPGKCNKGIPKEIHAPPEGDIIKNTVRWYSVVRSGDDGRTSKKNKGILLCRRAQDSRTACEKKKKITNLHLIITRVTRGRS